MIRNGIPEAGMPAFPIARQDLDQIVGFILALRAPAGEHPVEGDVRAGEQFFFGKGNCTGCHMVRGRGGILGPDLTNLARDRRIGQIRRAVLDPNASVTPGYRPVSVRLSDGNQLRGLAKNESNYDLQLQTLDGAWHLLTRAQITEVSRERQSLMPPVKADPNEMRDLLAFLTRLTAAGAAPASLPEAKERGGISFAEIAHPRPGDWPTYHGHLSGNRYSPLKEINTANVVAAGAEMDVPGSRCATSGSDAGSGGWRDVRNHGQRGLRPGRAQPAARSGTIRAR